jgi:hypothetical protein
MTGTGYHLWSSMCVLLIILGTMCLLIDIQKSVTFLIISQKGVLVVSFGRNSVHSFDVHRHNQTFPE